MILEECLLYEELPKEAQDVIEESKDSIENRESIIFNYNGEDFEVYMANTKSCYNEEYYVIQKFI